MRHLDRYLPTHAPAVDPALFPKPSRREVYSYLWRSILCSPSRPYNFKRINWYCRRRQEQMQAISTVRSQSVGALHRGNNSARLHRLVLYLPGRVVRAASDRNWQIVRGPWRWCSVRRRLDKPKRRASKLGPTPDETEKAGSALAPDGRELRALATAAARVLRDRESFSNPQVERRTEASKQGTLELRVLGRICFNGGSIVWWRHLPRAGQTDDQILRRYAHLQLSPES
jgi:hypothetical protein